jgi:hypothetical protein
MYEADIAFGMNFHPWRKVLDQCFVTRREAYEACGGLKPEFGHFSEWVLAASYHQMGYIVGYLPEARLHHYYVGSLAELKEFTLDFVDGEIRYFSKDGHEQGDTLLERPPEWVCRHNLDRGRARAILGMISRDRSALGTIGGAVRAARATGRWAPVALAGDRFAIGASALMVCRTRLVLMLATVARSRRWLAGSFRRYIAALIGHQRLLCISRVRCDQPELEREHSMPGNSNPAVLVEAGFCAGEEYQGARFRWSEPEALIRLRARGCSRIRVQCLRVRKSLGRIDLRVYLNGRRVESPALSIGFDHFEIAIEPPLSGVLELGWSCKRFAARADSRRLGIPVAALDLTTQDAAVDARSDSSDEMRGSAGAATTQPLRQHRLLLAR